jgi:hypothetical protein
MGDNTYGQLGDGFNSISSFPEQILPLPDFPDGLRFSATCQFGGTFYLLASANVNQPLNQWTPVWTNSVTVRGYNNFKATITNALNSSAGRQFYILQSR